MRHHTRHPLRCARHLIPWLLLPALAGCGSGGNGPAATPDSGNTWTISATPTALPATTAPVTGGSVQGTGSYADGAAVTLVAIPAPGFAFAGWEQNGATVATTARYTFTASADRSLTARFRIAQPLLGDMDSDGATIALASADLDGDGHADLVVVNGADQVNGPVPTRVWFGNGAGGFVDSGQALPGGGNVKDLALGDLDGDGAADLVLAQSPAGAIALRNDGKGVFTLPGTTYNAPNARTTTAVALGDVDADGDLDLVAGNAGEPGTVWRNDGQGNFADSGQRLGGFNPPFAASVALADLNRDGLPDLVFGNLGFTNTVWMNTGQGRFIDTNQMLGAGDTTTVAIGDIDNDKDLDVVFGNGSNGVSTAWRNDGTGLYFFSTGQPLASVGPDYYGRLALGDIDGDNRPDVVVGNAAATGGIIAHINDGLGRFTASPAFSGNSRSLVLADLDNDGDLDLVEGRANGSGFTLDQGTTTGLPNRVWLNDGNGRFHPAVPVLRTVADPWALALGRLNAGPAPDLVACSATRCAALLVSGSLLDGSATVQTRELGIGVSAFATPALGDLDGDGQTDIVIPAADGAHILLGNGNPAAPAFTDTGAPLGASAAQAGLADLDGDGDPDLVTAPDGQGDLLAWWNDGSAGFTATVIATGSPGLRFTALSLADLDGDGDPDLVAAAPPPLAVASVFRNDGNKTFTLVASISGGNIMEATTADLDGDGRPDLLLGTDQGLTLMAGNGDGTFAIPGHTITTVATTAVSLADLDGDGDLDLVAGHDGPDTLWINDGQGRFSAAAPTLAEGMHQARDMALADLDDDGDPDLVTANLDGGIAIHHNVVNP